MAQGNTTAIRYAEALYMVAARDQSFDRWLRELAELQAVLADPLAEQVLTSPAFPQERKSAILAEALPQQSEPMRRFVDLLLRRGRVELVGNVLEHLQRLVDEARGVQTVLVTTALPLTDKDRELIGSRLAAHTGKQIRLQESVDPSIIGGVVAQIGDEIIDDSVRGRLQRLRRSLAGV